MIINENIRLERKEKFSGKKFIDIGISEKNVKTYIERFKTYLGKKYSFGNLDEFLNWLDSNSNEFVQIEISNFVFEKNK